VRKERMKKEEAQNDVRMAQQQAETLDKQGRDRAQFLFDVKEKQRRRVAVYEWTPAATWRGARERTTNARRAREGGAAA
jgi:hypothetical protein